MSEPNDYSVALTVSPDTAEGKALLSEMEAALAAGSIVEIAGSPLMVAEIDYGTNGTNVGSSLVLIALRVAGQVTSPPPSEEAHAVRG